MGIGWGLDWVCPPNFCDIDAILLIICPMQPPSPFLNHLQFFLENNKLIAIINYMSITCMWRKNNLLADTITSVDLLAEDYIRKKKEKERKVKDKEKLE